MEETIYPNSTMISEFSYNDEDQTLTIAFRSGGTYSYSGVPEGVFQAMKDASSVGRFFLDNIRGQY